MPVVYNIFDIIMAKVSKKKEQSIEELMYEDNEKEQGSELVESMELN